MKKSASLKLELFLPFAFGKTFPSCYILRTDRSSIMKTEKPSNNVALPSAAFSMPKLIKIGQSQILMPDQWWSNPSRTNTTTSKLPQWNKWMGRTLKDLQTSLPLLTTPTQRCNLLLSSSGLILRLNRIFPVKVTILINFLRTSHSPHRCL